MIEAYDSDLTMTQQEFPDPLITLAKIGARLRTTDMMSVLNAIFYVVVTGCQWRQLSHDFPYWSTVYSYFRMWCKDGTCSNLNEHLRMQVRVSDERASHIVTQREPMQSLELYCEALKTVPITQSSEIVEPALEILSN